MYVCVYIYNDKLDLVVFNSNLGYGYNYKDLLEYCTYVAT